MNFTKVSRKWTCLTAIIALFIFAALLWIDVPVAQAENMTIRWFQPEATLISSDDKSICYKLNETVEPDKVHLQWNFSNGLDRPLADDLQCITLKTKDKATIIPLNKGTPPFGLDDKGIVEAGDFKYTKVGGGTGKSGDKSNELRLLELILQSTTLQPGTDYLIEFAPPFQANNGNMLGLTYSWEFTTSGIISSETPRLTQKSEAKDGTGTMPLVDFKDLDKHWARMSIEEMVAAGAASGYPDGTFKPNQGITRAEFASIIVKAFKLEPRSGKVFEDTANHWAREAIATAAAYGIVGGYSESNFGASDSITREQMAAMMVRAAGLTEVTEGKKFADNDKISAWAKKAVATASEHQLITGYPDNTFRPQAGATRAEAVAVIAKAKAPER